MDLEDPELSGANSFLILIRNCKENGAGGSWALGSNFHIVLNTAFCCACFGFGYLESSETNILLCFFNFFIVFASQTYILLCFFLLFYRFLQPKPTFYCAFLIFYRSGTKSGGPDDPESCRMAGSAGFCSRPIKNWKSKVTCRFGLQQPIKKLKKAQ